MERRLTAFLLPMLMVGLLMFFLNPGQPKAAPPPEDPDAVALQSAAPSQPLAQGAGQDPTPPQNAQAPAAAAAPAPDSPEFVTREFGAPGEPGSVWVKFDRRNASVVELRLLDEPADRAAAAKPAAEREIEESYALVAPVQRGLWSMTLEESRPNDPRLGVDLFSYWEARDLGEGAGIAFSLADPATGLVLEKVYRHTPDWRGLEIEVTLRADGDRPADATKRLPSGAELRLNMGGLCLVNPSTEHVLGQNPAIAIGRRVDRDTGQAFVEVQRPGSAADEPVAYRSGSTRVDFAGTTNRFFGAFLVPVEDGEPAALWQVKMEQWPRAGREALEHHAPGSVPVALYRFKLPVPEPGLSSAALFRLYCGPKSSGVFGENPAYERFDAVMDTDLTAPCFCEVPGARSMSRFLLWLLRQLHSVIGNWGWAIVVMTFLVRGAIVPLNFRMQKAMRKYGAKVSRLKPQMDSIKERNKNNPKAMQMELAAFQREHKLIPPLGGCLPLLITIPVFLGLFTALRVAYELRLQPFAFWILDLSQPDQLIELGWAWMPYFNLLPIIMVGLWLALQSMTPMPTDPQQRQVMQIMRFMPLMFGVMLYNYASGLMLYMICSSLFGLIENKVTKRILGPPPQMGAATMPTF
ncbi:MAG: membrane protein insertase YidC [Planctomycetota bacterium]